MCDQKWLMLELEVENLVNYDTFKEIEEEECEKGKLVTSCWIIMKKKTRP